MFSTITEMEVLVIIRNRFTRFNLACINHHVEMACSIGGFARRFYCEVLGIEKRHKWRL
ncbi:hypothetical protein C497_16807 [Halalkalicoccus jeotgali B3]|uniref:Uncharacterized protein n=1 Tax=Halalkalicoccus jeotgali (strain DSM 18796 / CECT 7217 / JCM 14584 / KCTC 4019 / B3) TaxID=795797 RepID=D8J6L7_HALJB|nr:hypothetical protein HacjB3_02505 [Halalkalicoccus jeotgali B3]ELY34059.1 hypothetical protein C497_16807 [Halalkalicoccus jeotgali B3]